VVLDNFGVV